MGQRNVTVVAGVSGTGKSVFTRRLLINGKFSVRFMFDAEFSERDSSKGEFAEWLGLTPAGDGYQLGLGLCKGWVCFDPHQLFAGRLETAARFFCEWAYEVSGTIPGEKVIAIPEVWRYCKPQSIPPELANIVQSGRKRGLHLVVDTQEPNRLNSSVLNGASEMVCFKLQSRPALDVAGANGFDPDEVAALPMFHLIGRNLDTGSERRGKIPFIT